MGDNTINLKRSKLISALLILLFIPYYANAQNLLENPGFETGTTSGWSNFAGCSIGVSTTPHTGTYSALVSNRSETWQGIRQSIETLINDGQTCTISGWVRLDNAASDSVGLTVHQTDDNGTSYHPVSWVTAQDDTWTYISGDFTLDVTGTLTSLFFYFEGPAAGVNFYVDDAELINPYIDPNHAIGQVDVNTRLQEIEGFGAAGAWYGGWLTQHPKKIELYDILFNQLGLDIFRIRNTYDIDQDNFDVSVEIAAQGEASLGRDLKIMISSWSPPAYLKSNDSTVAGTLKKDTSGDYMYTEFAQWWAQSLSAYSAAGLDADYINMQNEPDYLADWDSCKFTPTETVDWAGYNLAFEALYNELSPGPNDPRLLAPEAVGFGSSAAFIDALIDTDHVYGYAHHLYGDGSGDNPDGYIPGMTSFAAGYGDKPLLQTEYSHANETYTDAMNLALLIHNSLAVEGVTAYLYWDLFWGEPGGLVALEGYWLPDAGYTINPVYYAFKHYSAFIHSDWQRVDASTDSEDLRISAYISPDNMHLSVVLINTSADIDIETDLAFSGFTISNGNVYRTTQTTHCELIQTYDGASPLSLPAQSITTLVLFNTPMDCQQVQDLGYRLTGDLDGNCRVELPDLLVMVAQWLSTDPMAMPPDYSPDINTDDKINLLDFAALASDWLKCNDPEPSGCTSN
ncbi:MAG: carbohydrate binding domain-containing protein [Sedimentisphaerales bacterium]|nr:carbohydrate binding domain-containing protein [Sedimentisphaerales bacterium]